MTSIPVEMCRISSNNFQRHYLKDKRFCLQFLTSFHKSTSNLEHFFFKKDESPSLNISQIIDSERGGYLNVLKRLLSEHLPAINVVTG